MISRLRVSVTAATPQLRPCRCTLQLCCAVFDEGGGYVRHISAAFDSASAALLEVLQKQAGLFSVLTALKQYFLLAQGDLVSTFMDAAEEELTKPAAQTSVIRLQSLLEIGKHRIESMWELQCIAMIGQLLPPARHQPACKGMLHENPMDAQQSPLLDYQRGATVCMGADSCVLASVVHKMALQELKILCVSSS